MINLENIYDIRRKETLMYILREDYTLYNPDKNILSKTAVAIMLHYTDTFEVYKKYIDEIPHDIEIYIITSVPEICKNIELYKKKRTNITLLKKNNRGRDISGLLVAFREIALKYKYICYIHDKKEKSEYLKQDVNNWIKNLWENTLVSKEYIYNIINKFEENKNLGMLCPPEPFGEHMNTWFTNLWGDNFEITVRLADTLDLNCNIDENKQPITISTVFWARTEALKKLLERKWNYKDFPEEPLAKDGTLNHAIERILGYVSQDAGFKAGTIMTSSYAANMILYQQDILKLLGKYMSEQENVYSVYQMRNFQKQKEKIKEFIEKNEEVYLYGTGTYGIRLLNSIKRWGYEPKGFLVSNGHKKNERIENVKVYEIKDFLNNKNIGIILAVNYDLQKEISSMLDVNGFINYIKGYV